MSDTTKELELLRKALGIKPKTTKQLRCVRFGKKNVNDRVTIYDLFTNKVVAYYYE